MISYARLGQNVKMWFDWYGKTASGLKHLLAVLQRVQVHLKSPGSGAWRGECRAL